MFPFVQLSEEKQNIEQSEPFGLEHVQQQVDQVQEISQSGHDEATPHIEQFEHIEQRFDQFEESVPSAAAEHDQEDMDSQLNPGKYGYVWFGWAGISCTARRTFMCIW